MLVRSFLTFLYFDSVEPAKVVLREAQPANKVVGVVAPEFDGVLQAWARAAYALVNTFHWNLSQRTYSRSRVSVHHITYVKR